MYVLDSPSLVDHTENKVCKVHARNNTRYKVHQTKKQLDNTLRIDVNNRLACVSGQRQLFTQLSVFTILEKLQLATTYSYYSLSSTKTAGTAKKIQNIKNLNTALSSIAYRERCERH